jgi:hypothetical protein
MPLVCVVQSWQLFLEVTYELYLSSISNVINEIINTWGLLATVNSRYLLLFLPLSYSCKAILPTPLSDSHTWPYAVKPIFLLLYL